MSRRADFHQADLTRAIKAALDAGLPLGQFVVEAGDGVVRVLTTGEQAPKPPVTELERWRQKRGQSAA